MTNLISCSITYQWELFICYLCALWSTKYLGYIFQASKTKISMLSSGMYKPEEIFMF